MKRNHRLLFILLLVWMSGSYVLYRAARIGNAYLQDRRVADATRQAEYPWLYNPIGEESKRSLCQALQLPVNHPMCQAGTPIMFDEVVEAVRQVFPEGTTSYAAVERTLGDFPHARQKTNSPQSSVDAFEYIYQLTEYEGACVYFAISSEDQETVEKISGSQYDYPVESMSPSCWPWEYAD